MDRGAWWATVHGVAKSRVRHDWSDRDARMMTGNMVLQTLYLEICANIRFSVIAFWRWPFVVSEDEQQILSGYTSWIMSLTLLKTLQMLPHNLHYFKLKKSLKPAWFFSSFVGNLFFFFFCQDAGRKFLFSEKLKTFSKLVFF